MRISRLRWRTSRRSPIVISRSFRTLRWRRLNSGVRFFSESIPKIILSSERWDVGFLGTLRIISLRTMDLLMMRRRVFVKVVVPSASWLNCTVC